MVRGTRSSRIPALRARFRCRLDGEGARSSVCARTSDCQYTARLHVARRSLSRILDPADEPQLARDILARGQLLRCTGRRGRRWCDRSTLLSVSPCRMGVHAGAIAGDDARSGDCLRDLVARRHACGNLARVAVSTQPTPVRQRLVLRRGLSRVLHRRHRLGRVDGARHGICTTDRILSADAVGGDAAQAVGACARACDRCVRNRLPALAARRWCRNHRRHTRWLLPARRAPVPGRRCARQLFAERRISCSCARPAAGRERSPPGSASRLSARWSRRSSGLCR